MIERKIYKTPTFRSRFPRRLARQVWGHLLPWLVLNRHIFQSLCLKNIKLSAGKNNNCQSSICCVLSQFEKGAEGIFTVFFHLACPGRCTNWKNLILLLLCCWLRQGLGGVIPKIYFLKYIFLRCIFELIHSFEKEKKKWYVFLNINAFLISSKINQMPKFCKKSFSKATSIEKRPQVKLLSK